MGGTFSLHSHPYPPSAIASRNSGSAWRLQLEEGGGAVGHPDLDSLGPAVRAVCRGQSGQGRFESGGSEQPF